MIINDKGLSNLVNELNDKTAKICELKNEIAFLKSVIKDCYSEANSEFAYDTKLRAEMAIGKEELEMMFK